MQPHQSRPIGWGQRLIATAAVTFVASLFMLWPLRRMDGGLGGLAVLGLVVMGMLGTCLLAFILFTIAKTSRDLWKAVGVLLALILVVTTLFVVFQ